MINCDQIAVESARLKTMFAKCYNLKAIDLRSIVDLIESVSACSGGSFNLKTVNGQSLLGIGDIVVTAVVDGTETKVQQGTGITVSGNGSIANPYVITNSSTSVADGSETKINQGSNITVAGTGTTANPYVINAVIPAGTAQVNADWAAISGISMILNKPNIPTKTSDLVNDGADGINQFVVVGQEQQQSLQEVINVNKTADRVEFLFNTVNGGKLRGASVDLAKYLIDPLSPTKTYLYGTFDTLDNAASSNIVRINEDASMDTTFAVGSGFNDFPYSGSELIATPDGKLYVSGSFTNYNGINANRIISLNPDGSVNTTFAYGTGFNGFALGLDFNVAKTHLYVTGLFNDYNGTPTNRIIKLALDGSVDATFVYGSGFDNTTVDVFVDTDDSLFVSGYFGGYKGVGAARLVKLLPNGDRDATFNVGTGFNTGNYQPNFIFRNAAGILICWGYFTSYNGTAAGRVIALNNDGTVNGSYSFGTGFNNEIYGLYQLPNGKYVAEGGFSEFNGTASNGFIILNADFTVYSTFTELYYSPVVATNAIYALIDIADYSQIVNIEAGVPITQRKLTFSEVNGKTEYLIGGLENVSSEEIMPRRLIEELISENNLSYIPENVSNKQNSLAVDGTGSKYPTVDAVNASIPSSIYCWGDSMTFGTGSTTGNDYPSILSVYSNWKTVNKGIPGETSTEIKDRFIAFYTANPAELKKPVIIWAGRNNYPSGTTIKSDVATMIAMLPHSNYLIIGVTNSNSGEQIGNSGYAQIVTLNNELKTLYSSNFIDIRTYLVAQYNPSLPQDVIDFGLDLPPTSLLSDNIHLNDLGYRRVASFIANHFSLLENKSVTYLEAMITRNLYLSDVPNSILKTGSDGLVTNSVLYENNFNLGLGFAPNSVSDTQNFEFVNGGNVSSRVAVPQFSISSNSYGTWYAPKYKTSNFASQILLNGNGGDIVFYTAASGSADTNITFIRKFWIKNNGVLEVDNLAGTGDRVVSANPSGELVISSAPTAPTATVGTNTTQIATTAFVLANAGVTSTGTTNRIPKFTSSNSLGDSGLIQVGGNIGMGSVVVPGELFHIGDGNILLEGGGEVAQKFKRDFATTGENLGVPTGSGISVNPIFQVGRIIQAGDGDPEIRIMYSDDNASERTVFEVDRKGIAASVKTSIGSHFEGFASLTDVNPKFRLNSYPRMRLEMGAGGNNITDVAVERGATGSLDFFTNSAYRGGFDSSGNLNLLNTPTAPTAPAGTNTTQIATTAFVQATKPYKVYTALLTQGGTNAPVATVLENTLGGTVVWTRNSTGSYTGALAGVFTANKTWASIASATTGTVAGAVRTSVDAVMVTTSSLDSALTNSAIEIRVYN